MPEDLENIVKKAVGLQKHLKSKGDRRNVRSLELIEAKVLNYQSITKIGRIPATEI